LKGSKEFQKEDERVFIVSNIKSVDEVILSINQDRTQCETLRNLYFNLNDLYQLAFANAGDQNNRSVTEAPDCLELETELF
jgi:hypothetical protein